MNGKENDILRTWAHNSGLELSAHQVQLFEIYLDELWQWNRHVNLTGLSSRQDVIKELLLDSLIPCPFLPEEGSLLDVGSGAGFPAIPIKICKPHLKTHLVEANSKKVNFLKQVVRLTKLSNIIVIRGRIEQDGGILNPKGYHIITARALAQLHKTLTWCAPHLMPGGLIINFQGSRFEEALKESSEVIKKHQIFLYKTIPYNLPGKTSSRHILIFKKNCISSSQFQNVQFRSLRLSAQGQGRRKF